MTDLTSLSDTEILGLTIIGEARGEPIQGQVAVGSVIRNRVHSRSKSYYGICLEPKQFSCWNDSDTNRPMLDDIAAKIYNGQFIQDQYLKQCMFVAQGIVEEIIIDNTHGAVNYMTSDLFFSKDKPSWAVNVKNAKTIGNQIFFNV